MRVNILVGGPEELLPSTKIKSRKDEIWIGVDHGASQLIQWGIIPQIAIGDFDSTAKNEMSILQARLDEIKVYPVHKDFTDTQLGVRIAINEYQPQQIDVFGATGGRLDHLLANLFLPLQREFLPYLSKIRFLDSQNLVAYYQPGKYAIRKEKDKKYLAFVNLTPVKDLTLPDEVYSLDSWSSDIPFSWSSNEFSSSVNHFSFRSGILAVIQSSDEKNV